VPASALGSRPDSAPAPVRDLGYAALAVGRPSASFEKRPRLAVLSTARDEPADWLRAGQALQRVLLAATRNGIATSFLYQLIELRDIEQRDIEQRDIEQRDIEQRDIEQHDIEQQASEQQASDWWPWPECPQTIVRLGYGPKGTDSPRRQAGTIIDRPAGPAYNIRG
jgi:hypothetical protein